MLTDNAPATDQAATEQAATEQAAAAREARRSLGRLLEDLKRLPEAVRKAKARLPRPQEPVSLDQLLESRARAARHARRAASLLEAGDDRDVASPALADLHELVEEVRTGLMAERNLDDLGEMLAEANARPAERALRVLDKRVRRIGTEADRLFALAISAQQDQRTGAKPMPDNNSADVTAAPTPTTVDAVREVGQIIAATLANTVAGTPPPPARSTDRRYLAVADQIAASLQAYGLPHAGAQLPSLDAADAVRAQLIDGLQRNFASRREDGARVYYRTTPQPDVRTGGEDERMLRGTALVNAKLLRAEVDGVLGILDRLPDMLRFVPAEPRALASARSRLRDTVARLVAGASDPLGINPDRGRFQFQRLSAGVLEVLLSGEVISHRALEQLGPGAKIGDGAIWERLAAGHGAVYDDLRARAGAVRDEEIRGELKELGKLMTSVLQRVSTTSSVTSRGIAAARLEELLTAANGAVTALEGELERFGTSPMEQEVQFLSGTNAAGAPQPGISLGQFVAWVHAVCEPFAAQGHAAAAMLPDELAILRAELDVLVTQACQIRALAPVSFGGVWRQFDELKRFLTEAQQQAATLAAK